MTVRRTIHQIGRGIRRLPTPAMLASRASFYTRTMFRRFRQNEIPGAVLGRIELSLTSDYVEWDLWASIREFFQNAKDADDLGMKMSVRYIPETRILQVITDGAHLERKTLVLGGSTKRGTDQRGKFGEGYKLALGSLLHRGHKAKVYNWDEVWIPAIEHSKTFETKVLTINIFGQEFPKRELCFEVDEVSSYDYEQIKKKLLFGRESELLPCTTKDGSFLTAKDWVGQLFVRGIFVAPLPGTYAMGYDLRNAGLNRDRNLADPWSLKREIHAVLDLALAGKQIDPVKIYNAIEQGFDEGLAIRDSLWSGSLIPPALVKVFQDKYGEDAIPVSNNHDNSLGHILGREPIFVNAHLCAILAFGGLDIERLKRSQSTDFSRVYKLDELSREERNNYQYAIDLVNLVEDAGDVKVVDYFKDKCRGLYDGGQISLAKSILTDRRQVVSTLVHEVAHRYGGDGTIHHRQAEERIFSEIIVKIRT